MQITITKQALAEKNACSDGIEEFSKLFGEAVTLEWTRDKQLELLRTELRKFFAWAVNNLIVPAWSMSGADLSGANLSGADLSGADLPRADLPRADLSGAHLSWANLFRADLSGADLSGADLSGANLSGANLSRADLSGADGVVE